MQEIQRFNKVLKSCVLLGDIILLNSLLWGFELVLGSRFEQCLHRYHRTGYFSNLPLCQYR